VERRSPPWNGSARGRVATAVQVWSVALASWFGLSLTAFPASAQSMSLEYAIKAAYLYKFTPFIEWPPSALGSPGGPFNICVLGGDPFGNNLDQALSGHLVGDHPVHVLRLKTAEGADQCQILFLENTLDPNATAAFGQLRDMPVLTVADQGPSVGGEVVRFVVRNGHVRFTIDTAAAAAKRITISAKLLSLAAATTAEDRR
jgi:hypothetical protein